MESVFLVKTILSQAFMLELRNPHSVLATLEVRPKAVRSVRLTSAQTGTEWDRVAKVASKKGVVVSVGKIEVEGPGRGRRRETERTGAGSAKVEPVSPIPIASLWKGRTPGEHQLWLALDQIQDPQNLGAIFRLAGFFGVRGIVLTKDNSAPVNATVCDIATGGTEHVPYSVVPNLTQALKQAQKKDLWVLGTCERAETSIMQTSLDRNWILVMGNEADGLRRLTRETCDQLVGLSPMGRVPSLNVAAATASCLTALMVNAAK